MPHQAADYNLSPCEFVDAYCVDDAYRWVQGITGHSIRFIGRAITPATLCASLSRTYYCASGAGKGFFIAACVVWLGLLFLLLGSTADDYFSPALEQVGQQIEL